MYCLSMPPKVICKNILHKHSTRSSFILFSVHLYGLYMLHKKFATNRTHACSDLLPFLQHKQISLHFWFLEVDFVYSLQYSLIHICAKEDEPFCTMSVKCQVRGGGLVLDLFNHPGSSNCDTFDNQCKLIPYTESKGERHESITDKDTRVSQKGQVYIMI